MDGSDQDEQDYESTEVENLEEAIDGGEIEVENADILEVDSVGEDDDEEGDEVDVEDDEEDENDEGEGNNVPGANVFDGM